MISLPNYCKCSNLTVNPANWKTVKASTEKNWYIAYKFYDPTARDKYPHGKQVMIKGMNAYKNVKERQHITKALIDTELNSLQNEGYNPITGLFMVDNAFEYEIKPGTPFIKALLEAKKRLNVEKRTLIDIESVIKYVGIAAKQLRFESLHIKDIERRHIRLCLEHCGKIKKDFTANNYNNYRRYLSMLFNELVQLETVKHNPVKEIRKQKTISRIRETLTLEQRREIDQHLKSKKLTSFRLYMRIFFHSGARSPELLNVQAKRVDLKNQTFIATIKKGQQVKEVKKTIRNTALPYWKLIMKYAKPDDYIFSEGLVPGPVPIKPYQITLRWNRHVKKDLGITADFYSLKHANTTETSEVYGQEAAAAQNSHTSTAMVRDVYDLKNSDRNHSKLKLIGNSFL